MPHMSTKKSKQTLRKTRKNRVGSSVSQKSFDDVLKCIL